MAANDILSLMPILIRILVQRLLLIVFSFLAFFGINPDVTPPTDEAVQAIQERQDKLIEEVLQPNDNTPESVQEIEDKVRELQDGIADRLTNPVRQTVVEQVAPKETIFETEADSFDVRDAVVNVLCVEKTSTYTKMSTGSGVIVSSSGLVLTNAHVAYPFLQTAQFDRSTYSCSVRRENIPNYGYNAELVYYPLDWLRENSEIIKEPTPVGTGENDYAVLLLTTSLGPAPKVGFLPASTSVDTDDLKKDLAVTIAGYPSSNTGVFSVDANPGLKVADTTISDFFTFATRTFDILQTGTNVVAKRGSSGGGVFSGNRLYGLIVTTNQAEGGSYANALTLPYIKRDFESDTGINFDEFVATSLDILKLRFSVSYKDELKKIISESLGS